MNFRQTGAALAAILGLGLLGACGGSGSEGGTPAADAEPVVLENGLTPQEQIEMRQTQLKKFGKAFKAMNDELKSSSPDVAAIQAAAATLPVESAGMEDWFPAGSGPESGVKTDALPAIWENRADFDEKIVKFKAASDVLVAASATGDLTAIGDAFGMTGGTCKSCHDTYRKDD